MTADPRQVAWGFGVRWLFYYKMWHPCVTELTGLQRGHSEVRDWTQCAIERRSQFNHRHHRGCLGDCKLPFGWLQAGVWVTASFCLGHCKLVFVWVTASCCLSGSLQAAFWVTASWCCLPQTLKWLSPVLQLRSDHSWQNNRTVNFPHSKYYIAICCLCPFSTGLMNITIKTDWKNENKRKKERKRIW